MEEITIRRRNRLRHHYTIVSNVLLFGYRDVSDGAKLTYQVIDSFDWSDTTGLRKGYAYPSLGRLAQIRGVEKRSIRRHLAELEVARLITREERRGRPSVLVIEDPSREETQKYLQAFGDAREDKIVLPTPDKNVRPYKEDEMPQERQNLVNGEQAQLEGEISAKRTSVPRAKREYLAEQMIQVLHDKHSLGYYRRIAETIGPDRIFEALSIVRQMSREGRVKKSRGALFARLMRSHATGQHLQPVPRLRK